MATALEPREDRRNASRRTDPIASDTSVLLVPLGRALFSAIFILSALGHFSTTTIGYAAQQGLPLANILVPLSGMIALLGGVSILLGFRARIGAWLLVLFLVPVTFTMHRFWTITDPALRSMQQGMFLRNLAMLGAALLVVYFGAGPVSLDEQRSR